MAEELSVIAEKLDAILEQQRLQTALLAMQACDSAVQALAVSLKHPPMATMPEIEAAAPILRESAMKKAVKLSKEWFPDARA